MANSRLGKKVVFINFLHIYTLINIFYNKNLLNDPWMLLLSGFEKEQTFAWKCCLLHEIKKEVLEADEDQTGTILYLFSLPCSI